MIAAEAKRFPNRPVTMKKRVGRSAATVALVAVVALTLVHARVWGASAAARSQAVAYTDPVGDAGDAPDIVGISIVPAAGGVVVDIKLASATELGPYGWVLMGLDTDRNRSTGAPRGNEFLVLANGDRVVLTRWDGRHLLAFPHRPLRAVETPTNISFTLSSEDLRSRSFDFSAASLRQDADLAPADGVFTYAPGVGSTRGAARAR